MFNVFMVLSLVSGVFFASPARASNPCSDPKNVENGDFLHEASKHSVGGFSIAVTRTSCEYPKSSLSVVAPSFLDRNLIRTNYRAEPAIKCMANVEGLPVSLEENLEFHFILSPVGNGECKVSKVILSESSMKLLFDVANRRPRDVRITGMDD